MEISLYTAKDANIWDEFVAQAPMATFLHTRRYLDYHKNRFQDTSLLLKDHKNNLIGLFLAAVDPTNAQQIVSHPGITYGGLLHHGKLWGEKMLQAFQLAKNFYANRNFEKLRYKAIPHIYHTLPASDDLYALFRLGAVRYRCDLSCAINLRERRPPSNRRVRAFKKAQKQGVKVHSGASFAEELWNVLEENLWNKYKVKPVHSSKEILYLHSLFPQNIEFVVALFNSEIVAGVVLFNTSQVLHTQYIASSLRGYEVNALDAIFEYCIERAMTQKKRFVSFGVSTEKEGQYLNEGLYQFKLEFGGGGVVHEFYELNLKIS